MAIQLPRFLREPLLPAIKTGTVMLRIVLLIGMLLAIVALAVDLFNLTVLLMGFPNRPSDASAAEIGMLALAHFIALVALGMMMGFFGRLSGIIGTVASGNPFTLQNADRLHRMGWLALLAQLLGLPLAALADRLGPEQLPPGIGTVFGFSLVGLVLALAIFALARVFRTGSEMREDLEGTV